MISAKRHPAILKKEDTALLIIDIQEKIYKVMKDYGSLINNVMKLIKGMKVLNIPVFYTEQNPQGLGTTIHQIKDELTGEVIHKMSFSCSGAGDLFNQLSKADIKQVIVCGIESHVCVQQTVLDLLANGFQVSLPVNAVSSRYEIDYKTALNRMGKHGAEITTVESVLFELLEVCTTPEFKAVLSLIK